MIQQPETFLRIAKNHIGYIRRSKIPSWKKGAKHHDHAVVVIVMSAAAVESQINLLLSAPTLFISERRSRIYFGKLVTKLIGSPIHTKIKFIIQSYKTADLSSDLKRDIRELFNARNKIVHSFPQFAESRYLPEDEEDWPDPFDENSLPTRPGLLLGSVDSDLIQRSESLFESAAEFVKILKEALDQRFPECLQDFSEDNIGIE
jgi:hypothetical protein